jgi:thiamine-phosphate pyrophosphorylase
MNLKPLADCRLYGFVDAAYLDGRTPETLARQLCDGGVDLIQLRAKGRPPDRVRELADSLLPIAQAAGVTLVINDHLDIAQAVGAPLCHLGQEDFFDAGYTHVDQLPTVPHPDRPQSQPGIGLSSHAPAQAARALAAGADYLAIGPIYPTATKPTARPVTLEYVRWAAANLDVPWFAIGGITLDNLDAVLEAGARRICVVSAILKTPDPARACRLFRDRLLSAPVLPQRKDPES